MPNGNWIHKKYDNLNTLNALKNAMKNNDVFWGIACGMGSDIGDYDESSYARFILDSNTNSDVKLYPIAFLDFANIRNMNKVQMLKYFSYLKSLGYIGVKMHPRFAKFSFTDESIPRIIDILNESGLMPFLCTYIWGKGHCNSSSPEMMMNILDSINCDSKIVLVHGGAVRLMEYVEICRAYPNTLLDLSLTLCKYMGSSLDLDLEFCFKYFDRRICVGSDGPEFDAKELRERFEKFSENLSIEKKENIAHKNLMNFLYL
nr:putative monosaccharide biosynthesis protein [Vibrio mimicus]